MDFVDQIARLRVACETGTLAPDLGRWAVAELLARSEHLERVELRNMLIRAAADHLDGNRKQRAAKLRSEMLGDSRRRGRLTQAQQLIREALTVDPRCPDSVRQILRILSVGDIEAPTLSPDIGVGSK